MADTSLATTTAASSSNGAPASISKRFTITEKTGAIFNAPDNTVIIHACNCLGSWRAGIAAAFKERYPKAYEIYKDHCASNTPETLIGTALLIPPVGESGPRHFVGCLFTSKKYGNGRDSPKQILSNTKPAMLDLVKAMNGHEGGNDKIEEIRMCQINSGLFSVPWEKSKAVIENLEVENQGDIPKEIIVYSLPPPKK
jgi:ADP-ribose 1''-phosphate phosphatase